jgi:hypothetical protein
MECGELDKWKEVFNLYSRPGMEANAFAALTAFGAPLLKFTGQRGAIINLVFHGSGSGKSTTLAVCNSVWGHPDNLMCIPKDTINAKMLKLGVMNHLPFTMDEITNMTAEDFSDMAYGMTQGRWKDRVKGQTNELRVNNTFWQTMSLTSANAYFAQKLGSLKATPDGEMMRLLEYEIRYSDAIDVAEGKQLFDHQLRENYGLAGGIYASWLVCNRDDAVQLLRATQAKIDKELRLSQKERFWSATVAANIVGGIMAKMCGLIDWDIQAIYNWACGLIERLRRDTTAPLDDAEQVIGDYLYRHLQNILVVDDMADRRTNMQALPKREPKGELLIRIEPDTRMMFVIAKQFKEYCVTYQINYNETLDKLEAQGRLVARKGKRLSKGMSVSGDPIHCLWFKLADDFVGVEDYVKPDTTADDD